MVTLGDAIDKKLAAAEGTEEYGGFKKITDALGNEGLSQSLTFVHKLIAKDALDEDCIAGLPERIEGRGAAQVHEKLDAGKIDVKLGEGDSLSPAWSSAAFCPWLPVKKNKRK